MRRVVWVLLALLLAGCSDGPGPGAAGKDDSLFARTYSLNATLAPPVTDYGIETERFASSPFPLGGSSYTYSWTITNTCGSFESREERATWHHGDNTNCGHDSPAHDGTVTVVVGNLTSDVSSTGYMTCEYTKGSVSGRSDPCFVSSIAPEGQPKAKPIGVPGPGIAVALAALGLVALARRPRAPSP